MQTAKTAANTFSHSWLVLDIKAVSAGVDLDAANDYAIARLHLSP